MSQSAKGMKLFKSPVQPSEKEISFWTLFSAFNFDAVINILKLNYNTNIIEYPEKWVPPIKLLDEI